MWSLAPILLSVTLVSGHGRLIEPPSRSSMWRYGFNNPPNFNDHELYCGGFTRQWQINGGQCGVCGDPWDQHPPRDNEGGGKYGRGTITRLYTMGEAITVKIELTANHMGHFEFKLCPQNNPLVPVTQACLDRYLLEQTNGAGARYYPGAGNMVFSVELALPQGVTCEQCVLQWRYVAANNWGVCSDGTGKVGCGPQEEFRACSDVSIHDSDGKADNVPNRDVDIVPDMDTNAVDWYNDSHDVPTNVFYPVNVAEDDVYYGERTAVIVLASVLTAVLLFGAVFLYYYKVKTLIEDIELPSVPDKYKVNVSSIKTISGLCKLDKFSSGVKWPLSNVSLATSLPSFISLHKSNQRVRPEISAPIPIPPPRTRRGKSRCTSPSPENADTTDGAGQVSRRPSTLAKTLDISSPTEVTINGVTVGQSGASVMGHTAQHGPTPTSRGVICQAPVTMRPMALVPDNLAPARTVWSAHPVILNPDQPDSSLDIPPPLPDCPPPEDSLVINNIDSTDA